MTGEGEAESGSDPPSADEGTYRCAMPDSARDRGAADDLAAQRNEQVAQGHEWAAEGKPNSSGDLHSDAATKHRRAAGKDRSEAEAARNEADEDTDTSS